MNHVPGDPPEEATDLPVKEVRRRRLPLPGITFLALFLVASFLVIDFSNVLFAARHRRAALELVKPHMRLTQAERALNQAGYVTLYLDRSPSVPMLQVSTLNELPVIADLIHETAPNSDADRWMLDRLSRKTRFYVISNTDGSVKFTSAGLPAFVLHAPEVQGF